MPESVSTLPDQARWIETFVCEECGASRAAAATPQERRPCRFCGAGPEGPRADAPGRELEPALQEVARGARIAMLRLQTHQGWGEPVYRALGLLLGILLGLSITHTLWDSTLGPGLALTLGLSAWLLISGAYGIALHRVARWAAARRTRRRHTELELEAMQRRCPGCGIPLEAPAGAAFFECARCREPLIASEGLLARWEQDAETASEALRAEASRLERRIARASEPLALALLFTAITLLGLFVVLAAPWLAP